MGETKRKNGYSYRISHRKGLSLPPYIQFLSLSFLFGDGIFFYYGLEPKQPYFLQATLAKTAVSK